MAYASGAASGPAANVVTLVNVYHWSGSTWEAVATSLGSGAWLNPMVGFTVTDAGLTGGALPDFVVSGAAGASANGLFVVADVGGRWGVVPVRHPGGGPVFVDSRISGDQVQESVNDCVPNCAAGRITTTSYRFSPASNAFEPVGEPTVAGQH